MNYTIDNLPIVIVSAHAQGLDVDDISHKSAVILGASNTANHVVVHGATWDVSTRIMYGDAPALLYKWVFNEVTEAYEESQTPTELWGNAVDRVFISSYGTLINLNSYSTESNPNDASKDILKYSSYHGDYTSYGNAFLYKWDSTREAFVYDWTPMDPPYVNRCFFNHPRPTVLEGALVTIVNCSVDVDEDGPYLQYGQSRLGARAATQFSLYRETITTSYSASMVESTDCQAVPIMLNNGNTTTLKYRPMTMFEGLTYLNQMRSVRIEGRSYAPSGVCPGVVQHISVSKWDPQANENQGGWVHDYFIEPAGKESNYSLSNLVARNDFVKQPGEEEIGLVVPCGNYNKVTQSSVLGQEYTTGYVLTSVDPDAYGGMATYSPPRIKSYAPRFTHVEYDIEAHTLTWQEQVINSYMLFNNFDPEASDDRTKGWQDFGAGGPDWIAAMYKERLDGEEGPDGTGVPRAPWDPAPQT